MLKNPNQSRPKQALARDAGYSLLEILVVLFIIGILAGLVAPRLFTQVDKSKVTAAKSQAKAIRLALDAYRLDTGRYPTEEEGLTVLVDAPSGRTDWLGPYLDGGIPLDPWETPYVYLPPAQDANGRDLSPKVISLGADKQSGGNGINADISS